MSEILMTCKSCGQSFSVQGGAVQVFCTYCGTPHDTAGHKDSPELTSLLGGMILATERKAKLQQYIQQHPDDQNARNLERIFGVRYQPANRKATEYYDTFLRLWFDLIIQASNPKAKAIRKQITKFFGAGEVAQLLSEQKELLQQELIHAVEIYFISCKNDKKYTSFMFGLKSMTSDEISKKAAHEAVLAGIVMTNILDDNVATDILQTAAKQGFLRAFPEGHAAWNEKYNQLVQNH